jgi:hypothetical protein
METIIKTVNLKTGMPTVTEALQHLERELARPSGRMRGPEADPRLWIKWGRRRHSHRGAKTFDRDGEPR